MKQMWNMLMRHKLTPNQFYVMYSIREKETTPFVNTSLELRNLITKEWISEKGELSKKALKLMKEVEGFFNRAKKKTNKAIMGTDFEDRIVAYNKLWPKMRFTSGKIARSAKGNLEPAFRWFFENYDYTWEDVYKATALYLDEKEKENWNYTRNSQYFIRKQNSDKSWGSDLADYCQLIEDGGDVPDNGHFKEKIF